jgi:uracil-DNA glycosylase family 4
VEGSGDVTTGRDENARTRLDPPRDCPLCPRLHGFILDQRADHPGWFNAPVPTLLPPEGAASVRLLVVGLAPGLRGANRTGRPFTGDYAGEMLYGMLKAHGFSSGTFEARPDDDVQLIGSAITNAVRCVPPANKPVGAEINTCRHFLQTTITGLPHLKAILTLGKIAHDSTVRALGGRLAAHPFSHGGRSRLAGLEIFSSYHCSRYNTNTRRLTETMFASVFTDVATFLRNPA